MRRSDRPRLSIIVPAWNEERLLPRTLDNLHAVAQATANGYELIVVDNASTDATARIAGEHGARVVTEPERQISRARNAGARAAGGEWLLFVDADTWPDRELLQATVAALAGGQVCGGGTVVAFDDLPHPLYRAGARAWNALARRLRLGAGCYLFCTRRAFAATGGFSERVYAGEEVWLSRALRRWGRRHNQRFVILDVPVATSGRKAEWFGLLRQAGLLAQVLLLPWTLRSRCGAWFWYTRPDKSE
ncbi:glycosyltransferase [Thioalkalivibrio sp. ALJ16]|uniref:glycosyltransferase n=1 Tax=Thioalkalivibrio sp. ALJ16 TaxID=1158762 RepID=UPI00035DF3F7|nr:glycosyltransferase [Thioalkalivibrio sp. ALJ16]